MGDHALWAILLADCGCELTRIALPRPAARDQLPLRDVASEGVRHGATALVLVRDAPNAACTPCAKELSAIGTARLTLNAIGLRLHDYILWHGEHCVSLRAAGWL